MSRAGNGTQYCGRRQGETKGQAGPLARLYSGSCPKRPARLWILSPVLTVVTKFRTCK